MFGFVEAKKFSEAAAAVEKWERDVLRLQRDSDLEDVRVAILLEMMPVSNTEASCQPVEQIQPFPEVKEHLMKYLETRLDFHGVRPVDTTNVGEHQLDQSSDESGDEEQDWIGQGGGKNPKGKGKGPKGEC